MTHLSPPPYKTIIIMIYSHQDVHIKSTSSLISRDDSKEELKLPSLMNSSSSKSSIDALSCGEICNETNYVPLPHPSRVIYDMCTAL